MTQHCIKQCVQRWCLHLGYEGLRVALVKAQIAYGLVKNESEYAPCTRVITRRKVYGKQYVKLCVSSVSAACAWYADRIKWKENSRKKRQKKAPVGGRAKEATWPQG